MARSCGRVKIRDKSRTRKVGVNRIRERGKCTNSIVITLALGLTMEKLRAQSGLYSVHYRGGNRAHYNSARSKDGSIVEQKFCGLFEQKKNHKAVSMVITLTQGLTLTILQAQSIRRLNCLDKRFPSRHNKSTIPKRPR